MACLTLERQFHGTAALAILHLRRLAKSNDEEAGFAAARDLGMLDDSRERFMRDCLELDRSIQAGAVPSALVTPELIERLQACIFSINSADPA